MLNDWNEKIMEVVECHRNDFNELHRLDGPAVVWSSGDVEWWFNGWYVSNFIISWAKKMDVDLENLTEYDKTIIQMVWNDYNQS